MAPDLQIMMARAIQSDPLSLLLLRSQATTDEIVVTAMAYWRDHHRPTCHRRIVITVISSGTRTTMDNDGEALDNAAPLRRIGCKGGPIHEGTPPLQVDRGNGTEPKWAGRDL